MPKYKVEIKAYPSIIEIEADNINDAEDLAQDMWENEPDFREVDGVHVLEIDGKPFIGLPDPSVSYKNVPCKLEVPYVSVWDGGTEIETTALVDIRTGEVTDIGTVNVDGLEICEREYIVMNGEQVDVHQEEHGFNYWAEINNDSPTLHDQLVRDIKAYVATVVSEYHSYMPESFYNDIIDDVMACSAYDEGYYSEDDISLAFQRIIAKKFDAKI